MHGYKFYWYPSSAPCRAVLMLMMELGVCPEEFILIDLVKNEHLTEEFEAINPGQTVPALICQDRNIRLWEPRAILIHLAVDWAPSKQQREQLYPPKPAIRAHIDQMLWF